MTSRKYTAEEWAWRIRALIQEAEADGHSVWIGGYPEMNEGVLYIGAGSLNPAFEENEGEA